jgi:hypothetical protein
MYITAALVLPNKSLKAFAALTGTVQPALLRIVAPVRPAP